MIHLPWSRVSEFYWLQLAILLLAFVVLAGAWMGFWVVHKLVLTEEGSVDLSTSLFVEWSIRVMAAVLIIQVFVILFFLLINFFNKHYFFMKYLALEDQLCH